MRSRFSTLASSVFLALFAVNPVTGQDSDASASAKNKFGYIRFWNMLPPVNGTFDLRKLGGEPSEANVFAKTPSYRYSSYRELAPARYNLAVFRTGDTSTPLKIFGLDIKPTRISQSWSRPKAAY